MLDESKRQRAMRPEIRTIHAALAIVRPLYQEIYGWHVETAHLRGLSAVVVGDERRRSSYLEKAQTLLHTVRAARLSFEREIADLPAIVPTTAGSPTSAEPAAPVRPWRPHRNAAGPALGRR
jgi:hypothetical protein